MKIIFLYLLLYIMPYHTNDTMKTDKPKTMMKPLYPHKMYLGDKMKEAKDEKDHMKLSKQGYTMMKPKK